MGAVWRGVLLLLIPSLCYGISKPTEKDFMAIAGPLWSHGCNSETLNNLRDQIQTLQHYSVTHYKVQLDMEDGQLQCYKTLLRELNGANIRPIVILHDGDISRLSAGGSSPDEAYAEYAEFAFRSFGDLVRTWITFDVRTVVKDLQYLKVLLNAHERVYNIYHQKYSAGGGRIAIALPSPLLDTCLSLRGNFLKSVDFLALNIRHDCKNSQEMPNWTTDKVRGEAKHYEKTVEILIFRFSLADCNIVSEEDKFVLTFHVYSEISASVSSLMGYDISYILPTSTAGTGRSETVEDKSSSSRSAFTTVWNKFEAQTPAERDAFLHDTFPEGFLMGSSSSAFKVEGGWTEGDKGQSIWDVFGQDGQADNNATANVACDSYNKIDYDLYLLKGLQSKVYHFSISWSRIFPTGLKSKVNSAGVKYYNKLIDRLIKENIKPIVTLYHWDLPQALQESGGWQDDSTIEAFMEYADFCFNNFGDRVQHWITFHEPWVVSYAGYGTGEHAPGIRDPGNASFKVSHNIVKAHAKAWHVYNNKYRASQKGQVGISLNSDWAEPNNPNNPDDVSAAERYLQFMIGWFAHPILINGDYPEVLKAQVLDINTQCPSTVAELPTFTEEEKAYINGTADFLGISHYTSRLVNASESLSCVANYENIGGFSSHVDPSWPTTESPWLYVVPWGLRRLLNFVKEEYGNGGLPIYITGNGVPTPYTGEVFNDTARVEYLTAYINEALKAVINDTVTLSAYIVRSLLDGFEGPEGNSQRYGLHHVEFENANRQRTPKQSAYLISSIVENNGFPRMKLVKEVPHARSIHAKKLPALPASEVPSNAKVVWDKFSGQTAFERDMYHYSIVPSDFNWGASTSAYQIEGGWNEDGKGSSIWDTFSHIPGNIYENSNGDMACDSYHQLDADLYMLRGLGVNSYRFSISWSRVFPTGQGTVNNQGVEYYNRLIDGLLASNILPMVTLYHFDLPQALQDLGGWEDDRVLDAFHSYADFCFRTFGDRVRFWMTFNQPHTIAAAGYGTGLYPPGVKDDPGYAPYRVAHNLIKVHARVYHTYDEQYRKSQGGVISVTLNTNWVDPKDHTEPRDIEAADRYLQFTLGWFAHPIFKNGDYPEVMKWQVDNKSELQGLQKSRLPAFTDEEKTYIQGTADVFSINIYTTKIVQHKTLTLVPPSFQNDIDIQDEFNDNWPGTAAENLRAVAWGLRRLLNWVKEEYGYVPIYIAENGVAMDSNPDFDDTARIFYHKTYIDEALKALSVDGVNLKGYSINSLMDGFEWVNGYRIRFGLHHVDFSNPMRPRTAKRTAIYYAEVISNHGIPMYKEEEFLYGEFRDDFAWGVASSAFQIEGAWRADGKGLSIWDQFSHTSSKIEDDSNGDVACNSYYRVDEDIELIKGLGVSYYRFSISWPRILPDGTKDHVNEAGLSYYSRLIDGLLTVGITPQVTIYHWDLPQALQNDGGWENETIVERFKDYSEVLFQRLGDKVKFWITLNEPYITANLGYGEGTFAPGVRSPGIGVYLAGHNLIKAHAEVWHLYNDKYRASQEGLISITLNSDWAEPINPYKQEDIDAAWRYMMFFGGWFGYPIFKTGDYPEVMKTRIRERSLAIGLSQSRLPEFTESEKQRIKGTYDFFGLNHYTTVLVGHAIFGIDYQAYEGDRGVYLLSDRTWLTSGSAWLKVTPFGLRRLLHWIKEEFNNPAIYITENGISERGTNLNDEWRTYYYKHYVNEALKAVKYDGVDLRGYSAWSLMDNFEWATGYTERFGLYYTNFSDPNLHRLPKASVKYYRSVVQCNGFPDPHNGSHPCLDSEPEAGTTMGPTASSGSHTTEPLEDPEPPFVNFLGLKISTSDAMIALYVEFAFLLAVVFLIILFVFMNSKLRKEVKLAELF